MGDKTYKITKMKVSYNEQGIPDVDFFFEHSGDEPFTSTEFREGTVTASLLDTIEDTVRVLAERKLD